MDKLKYKEYFGTIQFSESDNCFYGKVLGMKRAMILFLIRLKGVWKSQILNNFVFRQACIIFAAYYKNSYYGRHRFTRNGRRTDNAL